MRRNIIKEIYYTEQTYIDGIHLLIQCVVDPIRESLRGDNFEIISLEDFQTLFKTLESIIVINRDILASLKDRVDSCNDDTKIGDIFVQYAPYLKIYSMYASQYDEINNLSKRLDETNKSYRKLLANLKEDPNAKRRDIYDLFITPIQRIPRYSLLLGSLIDITEEDHPDYKDLVAAKALVEQVADVVNKRIEESNNRSEVVKINGKFLWTDVNILDPARRFIKEGYVYKISLEDLSISQRILILFSDIVLLAIPIVGSTLSIDAVMPLKTLSLVDKDGMYQHSFYLLSPNVTVYIKCENKEEKTDWITSINLNIIEMLQANKFFGTERDQYEVSVDPKTNIPYLKDKNAHLEPTFNVSTSSYKNWKRATWHAFDNVRGWFINKKKNEKVEKESEQSQSKSEDFSIDEDSFAVIEDDSNLNKLKKVLNKGMIRIQSPDVRECSFLELLNEDWRHDEWPADSTYIVLPESSNGFFGKSIGYVLLENEGDTPIHLVSHMRKSDVEKSSYFDLQPQTKQRFDYLGLWCIEVRAGDCKQLRVLESSTSGGSLTSNPLAMIVL